MRRKDKKEIVCAINTLLKVHERFGSLYQQNRSMELLELLTQCQECAVQIGTMIEEREETGTQAISFLELYCEQLYQLSQVTDTKRFITLKQQLDGILNQVKYEVEEKIPLDPLKIVFLPYKASMWDCMESIWEAAKEDKECMAYVVPVPYYEKNKQGGIDKVCYEGELFPNYVPITSYKNFSLEKETPDVIYIHNPFDGANFVTSVHPDYYSVKLKQYTDMLVYVPYYFMGAGGLPKTHLNLPAYQYADKIIVQDEVKAEELAEYVPEQKLEILGSPKVDRLLKLQRQKEEILNHVIPKAWQKKIQGKKVVLFNISVSGILKNSDGAIEKIRYVLSRFEEREDVVLLWRPHPLIEATLKSMRPELYQQYIEIKENFVKKGNGILDNTADAGMSAIVADAYVGEDSSSIIHYFGVLGKPILFIEWDITEEISVEERTAFIPNDSFYDNGMLYFTPGITGMEHYLFQLDLKTGKLELENKLPGKTQNKQGWGSYCDISYYDGRIILLPRNADEVYIYNRITNNAMKLILSEEVNVSKFSKIIEYKGKLFLVPRCYPAIVELDMKSFQIVEHKECIKDIICKNTEAEPRFLYANVVRDNLLYLALADKSQVLVFNMDNGEFVIKNVGDHDFGYLSMTYDETYFWLFSGKNNCLVRWKEESNETVTYDNVLDNAENGELGRGIILNKDDSVLLFHALKQEIVQLDKLSGRSKKYQIHHSPIVDNGKILGKKNIGCGYTYWLDEVRVIMFNFYDYSFLLWNMQTNEQKIYPCRLPLDIMLEKERQDIANTKTRKGTPYAVLEKYVGITQFVDYIQGGGMENESAEREQYEKCMMNMQGTVGREIHNRIKSCCLEN